jgi:hypothetical protein
MKVPNFERLKPLKKPQPPILCTNREIEHGKERVTVLCFGADMELSLVHIGGVFAKSTCASQSKPPSLRFATTRELGGLGLAS